MTEPTNPSPQAPHPAFPYPEGSDPFRFAVAQVISILHGGGAVAPHLITAQQAHDAVKLLASLFPAGVRLDDGMPLNSGETMVHRKSGGHYEVLRHASVEASEGPLHEGDTAVVYRSHKDGRWYVRRDLEFSGRFDRPHQAPQGAPDQAQQDQAQQDQAQHDQRAPSPAPGSEPQWQGLTLGDIHAVLDEARVLSDEMRTRHKATRARLAESSGGPQAQIDGALVGHLLNAAVTLTGILSRRRDQLAQGLERLCELRELAGEVLISAEEEGNHSHGPVSTAVERELRTLAERLSVILARLPEESAPAREQRLALARAAELIARSAEADIQTRDHGVAAQGSDKLVLAQGLRRLSWRLDPGATLPVALSGVARPPATPAALLRQAAEALRGLAEDGGPEAAEAGMLAERLSPPR